MVSRPILVQPNHRFGCKDDVQWLRGDNIKMEIATYRLTIVVNKKGLKADAAKEKKFY